MPRDHVNLSNGASDLDTEGTELPDIETAQREALHLAGGIPRDRKDWTELGNDRRIEATGQNGIVPFRMTFSAAWSQAGLPVGAS